MFTIGAKAPDTYEPLSGKGSNFQASVQMLGLELAGPSAPNSQPTIERPDLVQASVSKVRWVVEDGPNGATAEPQKIAGRSYWRGTLASTGIDRGWHLACSRKEFNTNSCRGVAVWLPLIFDLSATFTFCLISVSALPRQKCCYGTTSYQAVKHRASCHLTSKQRFLIFNALAGVKAIFLSNAKKRVLWDVFRNTRLTD